MRNKLRLRSGAEERDVEAVQEERDAKAAVVHRGVEAVVGTQLWRWSRLPRSACQPMLRGRDAPR